MPATFQIPAKPTRFKGYVSSPENAGAEYLSQPSENCLVTDDGIAESRKGYASSFSIGVSGSPSTALYISTYDVCFFCIGTKVYYRNFNDNVTYDTGITLTAGTTTRMWEWFGMVFLTNTTDGIRQIILGRLNDAAATVGDGTVTIDSEFGGKLTAFGLTASNLRLNGVDEDMASLVVSTGVVTLSVNLTQSYADNTVGIVVSDISSGREKASKGIEWKSRFHLMGYPSASNADSPNNTVIAGDFVIGTTGAGGIEGIITFGGSAGSTKITVPGGRVANILSVADSLYFLTETKVSSMLASSVDTSGSGIGGSIPLVKDELHGCFSEDCATVMGTNAITYYDDLNHRIMRIPIDTESGAAIAAPEEDFDIDIRDHLKNLSKTQTGAFVYHYRAGRQTIYQLKEAGQWKWFIYDHNIVRQMGSNFVRGAWQPPQRVVPVKNLFERKGVLYGTDISTDTVYTFFTVFADGDSPINTTIATGQFDVGSSLMKRCYAKGTISYPAKIRLRCYVWNKTRGKAAGREKVILGSSYVYSDNESVGAVPVGDSGVSEVVQTAKWDKEFDVFPSEASTTQVIMYSYNGGYVSMSAFTLTGERYPGSFSASI